MADSNLYGLTTVQATLDSTSQLYAVTGTSGVYTDTRLPIAVLLNNTVLTGTPTVPGYLTSALAASTYLTQVSASSIYLTQATATSTYLTITTAASTYATITNLALKAPLASPNFSGTINAVAAIFTGLITPSTTVGIKGTAAADSAQAGSIGEYITQTAGGVSLTTGIAANVLSISLTAGDWDIQGAVAFLPAAGTTTTLLSGSWSTTTGTPGGIGQRQTIAAAFTVSASPAADCVTPVSRLNISTTTTVFLVASATFATSTMTCNGYISARRRR
jgi:hypothetical protein